MNSLNTPRRHTWHDLDRLHHEARERALALRAEAMDQFWRGVVDVLSAPRVAAQRAANRLAHRLARHEQQRVDGHSPAPVTPR